MELMCDRVAVINNGKIVKVQSLNKDEAISKDEVSKFEIKVKQVEEAKKIFEENLKIKAEEQDGKIYINVKRNEISKILKTLVLNNIDVESSSECEKTLENLFFDVTKKEENKDE